jgi:hypothetical protein
MRSTLIRSALAALFLAAAAPVASPATREAPPLLETIMLWLAVNFDLPTKVEPPALVSLTDTELVAMRYGPTATVPPGLVVAVYDDETIYLSEAWTGHTPADLSVLVHEMVHHLQAAADMRFACPAEREVLAYNAQNAWLALFGESLESAFGIDAATLLVGTVCTH